MTDSKTALRELISTALANALPEHSEVSFVIERPKQAQHGDYACNVAMQLARPLKRNPRELAQQIVNALPQSSLVEATEIAGAGFINFRLSAAARQQVVKAIAASKEKYGQLDLGRGQNVQVEFVSANPTGPLHVGHGRGAAYGASLSNLLETAGYRVTREYYVNDAGRQMDILALSTLLRYLDKLGVGVPFPPNAYQGDYVREMAAEFLTAQGDSFRQEATALTSGTPGIPDKALLEAKDADAKRQLEDHLDRLIANAKMILGDKWEILHRHVLEAQLADGRNDLQEFGVRFDVWFSEKSLYESGQVERIVKSLEEKGHVYIKDGAKWFRSTAFGDEKDRVVQRDNGIYTYFASDIAYHLNKYERGFDRVINIWGADHHGYIARVKGALQALELDSDKLHIPLVQFANLYREGKLVSMSTRSGEFVTLRELRHEVGNDAARFFYVLRKSDQHLDFDLDLAKSQSNDNPVYYIQYAHARICRVLEEWGGAAAELEKAAVGRLESDYETALLRRLSDYSDTIESAARDYAPHNIAFYLKDLAADLHSYYNAERFLSDDAELTLARLALLVAVKQVLANGLSILGVSAPEKM